MTLKLIIEKPVSSKKEYESMKKRAKLSNETWKLKDPNKKEFLDVDLSKDLEKKGGL